MANPSVQKCPEPVVLPIIFVPGIMGSRLKNSEKGYIVWDPDSKKNALSTAFKDAISKRNVLIGEKGAPFDPNYLEVDLGEVRLRPYPYNPFYTGKPQSNPEIKKAEQRHEAETAKSTYLNKLNSEHVKRGWGGLLQSSYLGFVEWLAYSAAQPGTNRKLPEGCQNVHYEVWAHPYNWTDDNLNSGKKLGDTVDKAYQETRQKYESKGVKVLKPIIITHSMCGLVARAYTQIHGGAGKVHGVIHGALPCDGAPATYKRIVAGFEDGKGLIGPIERHVLGANRQEATATAANMPGALELLPNQFHKGVDGTKNWLRCTGKGGNLLWSKPIANPYAEIYLNQTDWWRLIEVEYLNPGSENHYGSFASFVNVLQKAQSFHAKLGPSAFHPNTRMFYANDPGYSAWDHIEWRQTANYDTPPSNSIDLSKITEENSERNINVKDDTQQGEIKWSSYPSGLDPLHWHRFENQREEYKKRYPNEPGSPYELITSYKIQPQNAPGDGTVHAGSGLYVSGPMSVATNSGFEHQNAYEPNPPEIRELVAGWIYDMVEEQL